ncbi:MAG: DUF192 domain-containing protein [Bacteriovoracia bacterium]
MKITRKTDQLLISENCETADTFFSRFRGLMGRDSAGGGLLLQSCNSIHTFFMKIPIDVIYLDKDLKVLKVVHSMKPWRVDFPVFGADSVLELESGRGREIQPGDVLCLS